MSESNLQLTPGGIATLACLMEVTAPKPGNVHRSADFEDTTFMDFSTSAVVLGQVIDANVELTLGETILAAVTQTRLAVGTNTNLGIVLLVTPLAKMLNRGANTLDQESTSIFMNNIDASDGRNVFEAIRVSKPGGLGKSQAMDINATDSSAVDLLEAMEYSKDRDAIARQYVTGFQTVFDIGVPKLCEGLKLFPELSQAIVFAHVALMANESDSLIARKCGDEVAAQSQVMALKAIEMLNSESPVSEPMESLERFWAAVGELDFWLRSDGHRRNPGTTADLIAASLFVAINNGNISAPLR